MLEVIGAIVVGWLALRVLYWLYSTFLRTVDYARYNTPNSFVVVTGGTDGIGLGLARAFAKRSFNLVLVSRNSDKLNKCRDELLALHPTIRIEVVVSEAEHDATPENIAKLADKLARFDIAILVNNVGITMQNPGKVEYNEPNEICRLIKVNCMFPTLLTNALIKRLRDRAENKHRPTAIINVASVAGHCPAPHSAIYSATKAFNWAFSRSLTGEYVGYGIDVLTVSPGYVASNMTGMSKGLIVCTPDECAEGALRRMGQEDILPHWKHAAMYTVAKFALDSVPAWLVAKFFSLTARFDLRPKYRQSKHRHHQ